MRRVESDHPRNDKNSDSLQAPTQKISHERVELRSFTGFDRLESVKDLDPKIRMQGSPKSGRIQEYIIESLGIRGNPRHTVFQNTPKFVKARRTPDPVKVEDTPKLMRIRDLPESFRIHVTPKSIRTPATPRSVTFQDVVSSEICIATPSVKRETPGPSKMKCFETPLVTVETSGSSEGECLESPNIKVETQGPSKLQGDVVSNAQQTPVSVQKNLESTRPRFATLEKVKLGKVERRSRSEVKNEMPTTPAVVKQTRHVRAKPTPRQTKTDPTKGRESPVIGSTEDRPLRQGLRRSNTCPENKTNTKRRREKDAETGSKRRGKVLTPKNEVAGPVDDEPSAELIRRLQLGLRV